MFLVVLRVGNFSLQSTHLTVDPNTNIGFQYIDFYVSTIPRLLVMSVIKSRTPNYLRYIKTHKLVLAIATER